MEPHNYNRRKMNKPSKSDFKLGTNLDIISIDDKPNKQSMLQI